MTASFSSRKKLFLPGTFQGKLARRVAAYWVMYHLAMWHSMFFLDYITSQAIYAVGSPPLSFSKQYLLFARQNWTLAMWAIVIGPVFAWQFIVYSHRIVGPLVRLERTLLRMAKGESVPPLKFRDGDFAVDLEKAFNAYLMSLSPAHSSPTPATDPQLKTATSDDSYEAEALNLLRQMHREMSTTLQSSGAAV